MKVSPALLIVRLDEDGDFAAPASILTWVREEGAEVRVEPVDSARPSPFSFEAISPSNEGHSRVFSLRRNGDVPVLNDGYEWAVRIEGTAAERTFTIEVLKGAGR